MIHELAEDMSVFLSAAPASLVQCTKVRLVLEAIRRHQSFISSHPTSLFQCLWNDGWWYDSPALANYFELSKADLAALNSSGPRLHHLLELWHTEKKTAQPTFHWVRSLCPPPVMLGTARRMVLREHEHSVKCVGYSPDGRLIASGDDGGVSYIWDAESGRSIAKLRIPRWIPMSDGTGRTVLTGDDSWVTSLDFSPENRFLVTGHVDKTVRVWETENGTEVLCLTGHEDSIASVQCSTDGTRVFSLGNSWDNTIRVWDMVSGRECLCIDLEEKFSSRDFVLTPDGTRVAVTGSNGVTLYDASTGQRICQLKATVLNGLGLDVSPDGERMVVSCKGPEPNLSSTLLILSANTGEEVCQHVLNGRSLRTSEVCFSPCSRYLAFTDGPSIRLIDSETGTNVRTLEGNESWIINGLAFSPDGKSLVSCDDDRRVSIWDLQSNALQYMRRDTPWLKPMDFSPDGDYLAIGCHDGTIRILDASRGVEKSRLIGHKQWVNTVRYSPCGRWLASGAHDSTARIWDLSTGLEQRIITVNRYSVRDVNHVCFYPSGKMLVTGDSDNFVRIYDLTSGEEVASYGHGDWVYGVDVSLDENRIASASRDNTVIVWDIQSSKVLSRIDSFRNSVTQVLFSQDGKFVLVRSNHGKHLSWYEVETGRQSSIPTHHVLDLHTIRAGQLLSALVLSNRNDGSYLVESRDNDGAYLVESTNKTLIPSTPYSITSAVCNPRRFSWAGVTNGMLYLIALEPNYSENEKSDRIQRFLEPESGEVHVLDEPLGDQGNPLYLRELKQIGRTATLFLVQRCIKTSQPELDVVNVIRVPLQETISSVTELLQTEKEVAARSRRLLRRVQKAIDACTALKKAAAREMDMERVLAIDKVAKYFGAIADVLRSVSASNSDCFFEHGVTAIQGFLSASCERTAFEADLARVVKVLRGSADNESPDEQIRQILKVLPETRSDG